MKTRLYFMCVLSGLFAAGCASTHVTTDPKDPFEGYNRVVYSFNQHFDDAVAKPVAKTYKKITPVWVDAGITNFFSNLGDVIIVANDLLQLKLIQTTTDTARLFFNTTIGVFGFIDVASHMDLPKHNEDFGQTLGYWGVPPGPYFVLPFLGPSTIRDTVGLGTDYFEFDPVFHKATSAARNSMYVVDFIDTRADLLSASRLLKAAALDPYTYTREAYFQRRRYYIYDGNPPPDDEEME